MSRTAPLEVCALCNIFQPTSELEDVPFLDANRNVITLRICRRCRKQQLTYIQARWANWIHLDVPRTLMVSLVAVLVVLNVIFALIIGGSVGFAVMLSAMLVGAGFLALVAASCILSS